MVVLPLLILGCNLTMTIDAQRSSADGIARFDVEGAAGESAPLLGLQHRLAAGC